MRKNLLLSVILVLTGASACLAQSRYQSINKGNWESAAVWMKEAAWMTNPPPSTNMGGGDVVTINDYITRNGDLAFTGGASLQVYDTLVITGDLSVTGGASVTVHPGGVLVVLGNFTMDEGTVTNNGKMAVIKEFVHTGGTITTNDRLYIYDDTPTYDWGATIDGVTYGYDPWPTFNTDDLNAELDNEQELATEDPVFEDFLDDLGVTICSHTPTYKTTSGAGNWTNNGSWVGGTRPSYTLTGGAYTIPAGHIVVIESGNFSLSNANLIIHGTLIVNGTLVMSSGKTVNIMSGGAVTCCQNCNNSNKIRIGSTNAWTGNDGTVNGPATISEGGILPVKIIFFTASSAEHAITLTWATATEVNFDKFIIERSINGTDYEVISSLAGKGNSVERADYAFEDRNPFSGKNYYRLKCVDLDGYVEYSSIVFGQYDGGKNIVLYPNPSDGSGTTLLINFTPSEGDRIQVFSNLGVKMREIPITQTKSAIGFEPGLKPGAYILKYTSASHHQTVRLIVK